jgi:hypothetical protein
MVCGRSNRATAIRRNIIAPRSGGVRLRARLRGWHPRARAGTVVSLEGSKLVVHAKDRSDVTVSLADNFAALPVVKSSMADIKEGTFVGTATVTQPDTTLRSVEVVVFADDLRGTAEGHYPWDLGPKSMMTNATLVNAVKGVDGQTGIRHQLNSTA